MMGINISDKLQDFTRLVLDGYKTIETRDGHSLDHYLGRRVGIISTHNKSFGGKAHLVGYATIAAVREYHSYESFDGDRMRHQVKPNSHYDWNGFSVGYELAWVERCTPTPISSKGIIARQI